MAEPAHTSVERLRSRLEFETLLADLSSRFINLAPAEVDLEVEDAMRSVCAPLGVELAVLWQWSRAEAPGIITPTHWYTADGSWQPEAMNQQQFPWYVQQMLAGRVCAVASLDDLPAEAGVDRETCRALGIKSNLTMPMTVGGERPVGALGFSTLQAERDWPEALVRRLQLFVQVLTNALARKRSDETLRESEQRLELAVEAAGAGLWVLDFGTGAFWTTNQGRAIFGYGADEVIDLDRFEASVDPDDWKQVRESIEKSMREGSPVNVEYRITRPGDGEQRWIASRGRPQLASSGHPERLMGVSTDITEHKRAEEDLQAMSRALISAQEEERALLARELHDDVTQRLAVLSIELGVAEVATADRLAAEALRSVREEVVRLSEDVHSLAYQLHPSVLEELGLTDALQAECDRRSRVSDFRLTAELERVPAGFGKAAALCLFRVAQEALVNAARHAAANKVTVTLRNVDGGLLVSVRDDGCGFDPAQRRRSLGLASMRERIRLVDGRLNVASAPGHGTEITAWAPAQGDGA